MLRDVFYYGTKPNAHPREKYAIDLDDARQQSTTEHFWIINEFCDYKNFDWDFDFEFLPDEDVWAENHINVWPSQHQKDSGTWLVNTENTSALTIYRNDVDKVIRKNIKSNHWICLDNIDEIKFDFSWHPDPTDPPYIYKWGCKFFPAELKHVLEYRVPNATQEKYMTNIVELLPNFDCILEVQKINSNKFDLSWRPNPLDPPYIYVWGNKYEDAELKSTLEYKMPGAIQIKYMAEKLDVLPQWERWIIPTNIDTSDFDFTWRPDPREPAFIYEFGTQHQKTGGPQYMVEGATEKKYIDFQKVKALPSKDNWIVPKNIDISEFDFSWHPDTTDPLYIYQFGTQWALSGGPKYVMSGATEIKYMDNLVAKALPNRENWIIPDFVDVTDFDYSWHPYAEDEPFIYQFGTQHQKTGGHIYVTPGTHKNSPVKYIDTRILKSKRLPNKTKFAVLNNCKIKEFDYSWHPDDTEEPYIYIFGNNQYSAEIMPTIEYSTPNATQVKYINTIGAILAPDLTNWEIPKNLDVTEFDFSWKPNPKDPPFVYQFGTQHQKTGGPRYIIDDATQVKYIEGSKAKSLPNKNNWVIPVDLDIVEFDYSWHPDDTENALIYIFPTQWQLTGGPKYIVKGATEFKFMDNPCAIVGPNMTYWTIPDNIALQEFDFSWHPHPDDPTFIYHFATQWHDRGGPVYTPMGADKDTPIKYIDSRVIKATLAPNQNNWEIPNDVNVDNFDFSWVPHPDDPPFIYQFGTQHQKTGGPKYVMPGAIDIKYINGPNLKALKLPSKKYWSNPNQVDTSTFDYSWHPDETAPPYIYQFGTLADPNDGPRYILPNALEEIIYLERIDISYVVEVKSNKITVEQYYIETTLDDLVKNHPNEVFWALNKNINYTDFNFDWRPDVINIAWESDYVHVFGSPDSITTQTYFVNAKSYLNGKKNLKFVDNVKLDEKFLAELFVKPDIFFVDRGNPESNKRFELLQNIFEKRIQKTRYLNSWVDTINRCINRATSNLCWILNSELDYSSFNFDYYPNPWQMNMVHVFGTQWSHWGTTFMVNRETFATDTKYIKIIEHLNNLNFVKENDKRAKATNCLYDVIIIDHGNQALFKTVKTIQSKINDKSITTVTYNKSYLQTFKDILTTQLEKKEHFVWICSSVCDYSTFDFTYICDPFARENLHVFPSDKQKFGDTFLVNINQLRNLIDNMTILEEYGKVNYNQHQRVKRLPAPVIVSEYDTHVASVVADYDFPYAIFVTEDNKDLTAVDEEPMSLWAENTKNIIVTSTGGTRIIAPKEAKDFVETQLYDYPYIKKNSKLIKSNPLDIIYLSNGEQCADENYEHLLSLTKDLENRVIRINGVNGRVQAYHAAAEASKTPWMFTVFAKLKVDPRFDFNWQPDRLQMPKHYMFNAKNPLNGLIYGHQGIIAYNTKLVLANRGEGLDFTLDDPHESVNILSGTAHFNTDTYSTWRTAFREVIKLKHDTSEVSKERLEKWLTVAEGNYAEFCLQGASDAIEYYENVNGNYNLLKLSYEWNWLYNYYSSVKKYPKM